MGTVLWSAPCPAQGSGTLCPHHVLAAPALTFFAALAKLLFMQHVPGGRTACFHAHPLPPHPSSTLPSTAPVCEAQGSHTEPQTAGMGVLGRGQHPVHHTAPLCPHQYPGVLLLGLLPSGGSNWQMRQRAGERLGQRLRVSQTGLMLGHGGLTAPRLPSEHPQPTLQLGQGLSLRHPPHAWMPGQYPCQGRGHQVCPTPAFAKRCRWHQGGYHRAKSHPGMSPKLGQTLSPLSLPWYVDEEPPCGPSPPGRRQQDQDRGYPVHTALQIRDEMPQGTPAIPPHSGHGGHQCHPKTLRDTRHTGRVMVPSSPWLAWPAALAQRYGTGQEKQCTEKLQGVAMEAAAPK